MRWPWQRRHVMQNAEPVTYQPDPKAKRELADWVARALNTVELLEIRRDVQFRGSPYGGKGVDAISDVP